MYQDLLVFVNPGGSELLPQLQPFKLFPYSLASPSQESRKEREEEELAYKEAFDYYDWNKSGTIPTGVSFIPFLTKVLNNPNRGIFLSLFSQKS